MGRISLRPYSIKTYWPTAGSGCRSRVSRGGIQPLHYGADFVGGRRNLDWCNASAARFSSGKRKTIGRPSVGGRAIFAYALSSRELSGFRDWFDASEQKHIAGNADQEKDRGRRERSGKGIRCPDNIAGNDRRGDSCKVIAKIDDSAEGADALAGSYQRRNRPTHW